MIIIIAGVIVAIVVVAGISLFWDPFFLIANPKVRQLVQHWKFTPILS